MRVLMAMSGGVDSTAAALKLLEQGCEVVGCTFRTRYTSATSLESAVLLAQRLGIEHHILDYDGVFDREVVSYFRTEYLAGRTPNPCVVCNRTVKFGLLLDEADRLGCDKIATGHYAALTSYAPFRLRRAKDRIKDQTYFLWQLPQECLVRVIFPLGDCTKQEVRAYLAERGFAELSHQGESQDICFIRGDYRDFLKQTEDTTVTGAFAAGDYVDASGRLLGRHSGYANYTIGQRKGLGIALGTPAFVTHIDSVRNEVTLGTHDDLLCSGIAVRDGWFAGDETQPVMAQIRYRSKGTRACVRPSGQAGKWLVLFDEPVWAVTPGQSAVFYQNDILVGGGVITGIEKKL